MSEEVFKARLEPSGREFSLYAGESVLNSALRQRILLQYGCRNGRCSSCKYFLIDGEVDFGKVSPYSLSENEKEEGWALLCQARALSDLTIRDQDIADRDDAPVLTPRDETAEIFAIQQLTESLWGLQLALPHPLTFYPGQFIEVEAPGRSGSWRCYSIAGSAANPERIDLIVKRITGGEFSGQVERLARGSRLAVRGPYGMSYLRDSDRPILLVATGSGLAPLLSILRTAAERRDQRHFQLYYGARTTADLIFHDELCSLEQRLPHFRFKASLSAPASTDLSLGSPASVSALVARDLSATSVGPSAAGHSSPTSVEPSFAPVDRSPVAADRGRAAPNASPIRLSRVSAGRVTQALQRDIADASPFDAYICGHPDMCESVATLLLAKGIPENRIFRDDFYPAV
jgi:NAD(P)H-flavin reductase/ferredoxin